jgi:hypothetical protein
LQDDQDHDGRQPAIGVLGPEVLGEDGVVLLSGVVTGDGNRTVYTSTPLYSRSYRSCCS